MAKLNQQGRFEMTASVKRLFSYLLAYKSTIAIAVVAMLLSAATSSLIALLLGKLTDMGFYEKNPVVMWWAPAALVGIALVHGGATFTSSYLLQKISQSVLVQLRESMFRNVISWPARTYQRYTSGAVISKFVNEASNALGTAAEMVSTIVRDSLQIVALSCVLVYQNWKLTLVALIVGPLMALLLKWVTKRMRQYTTGFQQTLGDMTGIVQEAYEGQRIIKIYDGYETELARFSEVNERIRKFSLRAAKVSNAGTPLAQFITMSAVSIVVVVALAQAQAGILTMGEFITYLSALLLLMPPIRHLSALNGALARLSAAAESVFALMDEVAEESRSAKEFSRVQGNVRFEHVSLCYDETQKPALEDFTLDVKAGETIALVGSSGAGKTTLINLIPRFWEATAGRIYFDGTPIDEVSLKSLRAQIALVSQDVVLFDDTIAANIAYGAKDASRKDVEKAAEAACLMPFIQSLPMGLDTPVGEAGSKLSGGQKQRISIARALLKNAPILLLDEATSALDTESEKYIQRSLDELMKGRTTFVVAHRLTTIEGADRIVVMRDGRIQEVGKHSELLAKNGMYAHLYNIQFSSKFSSVQEKD
jgi:subfamily B ATP-binding cassette protein MsbA